MAALPSPTPSPGPQDAGGVQQGTKKRQRSASMHSATSSSSPKRSQSQGPIQEPMPSQPPPLPDYSDDTDVPMSIVSPPPSGDISPPAYAEGGGSTPMWQDVPAEQKSRLAETLRRENMNIGETWYLVSVRWYKRWEKAVTGTEDKEGPVEEKDLGPVDNSDLLEGEGELVSPLEEGTQVYFVPERLWEMLVAWYGQPAHPLPRKVMAVGVRQEPTLEIRPPRIKSLLLVQSNDPAITGPGDPSLTLSADTTVQELRERMFRLYSSETTQVSYRIWRLLPPRTAVTGFQYPTSRLLEVGGELLNDEGSKTLEEALIQSGDLLAVEVAQEGNWLVNADKVPATTDAEVAKEELPPPLFASENNFFDRMQTRSSTASESKAVTLMPSTQYLGPKLPSKFGTSRFVTTAKARDPGTLGLGNMGNTCFMNSALQCLSHTTELADYFLTDVFKEELNPDNPLGMKGEIAEVFGALLHRIWQTGSTSSYSPREFKQALQRFAPQFSGYQQHDSQELVAFLLDGLHEDLNRIIKKPYVEKPDWEGGGDREMAELAQASWEGYLKRNDSVIVDLFQGQYRSTLVCPECEKVSITFDPFMYLTLPLPITKKWKHIIFYVPWDFTKPHVKVPVEINADASFKDLRNLLGKWMGAEPNNLVTMEIWNNKFYKALDDHLLCGEFHSGDTIVCYELPCHAQQNRSYKKQDGDPFVLQVSFARETPRTSYGRSGFGYPFFIAITQEQAKNAGLVYEAVVNCLQRWTIHARDLYHWQVGSDDTVMEEIPIPDAPAERITEIQENGEVVTIAVAPEEGDIVDEKSVLVADNVALDVEGGTPQKGPAKQNIFSIKLANASPSSYGTLSTANSTLIPLEQRQEDDGTIVFQDGDSIVCEFDDNMQDYFFNDHALWDTRTWEEFIHPELQESRAADARPKRGISLQDCLNEFVKEEQLGEDDLWYCPRCKKHQQATKKFDLWKVPDVLVVHLKRFSNSRSLRDKIDTFVDFPIEGLDLEVMVEERKVAQRLEATDADVVSLGLDNSIDPLVYDLFAVDEHMGGLGGGHYRAYAHNHVTDKWYHFDDSHVTESRASEAVNANAYLLFYRRRTGHPLGGKTHHKIEEARRKLPSPEPGSSEKNMVPDHQLPTPPDEGSSRPLRQRTETEDTGENRSSWPLWNNPREIKIPSQSPTGSGSPSGLDYPDPMDELQLQQPFFPLDARTFDDYADRSLSRASVSPSSSGDLPMGSTQGTGHWSSRASPGSRQEQLPLEDFEDILPNAQPSSPRAPRVLDTDTAHVEKEPVKEIPVEESTLLDIE